MAARRTKTKSKADVHTVVVSFARATRPGNSVVVTIPKAVREVARIEVGEYLRLAAQPNQLGLSKAV